MVALELSPYQVFAISSRGKSSLCRCTANNFLLSAAETWFKTISKLQPTECRLKYTFSIARTFSSITTLTSFVGGGGGKTIAAGGGKTIAAGSGGETIVGGGCGVEELQIRFVNKGCGTLVVVVVHLFEVMVVIWVKVVQIFGLDLCLSYLVLVLEG